MKMRLKPKRGEIFKWNKEKITILKIIDLESVEAILENGKTARILKNDIELPIIETQDYEKIQ